MKRRWKIFADTWLRTWNETKSAIAAGYSERSAYSQGNRLMRNAEVAAYIHEHLMKEDEIVSRLQEQARGAAGYFDPNTGQLEIRRLILDGKDHLIKKQKKDLGKVEIELYDAQAALIQLGKYRKLWTDKNEVDFGDRTLAKMEAMRKVADKIYAEPESSSPGEDSKNSA